MAYTKFYDPANDDDADTPVSADWANHVESGIAAAAAVADASADLGAGGQLVTSQREFYGTAPPASPQDGDIWVLPADTTNGNMWRFRYRAASVSSYKWEFVGGTAVQRAVDTQEGMTTAAGGGSVIDLATPGPSFLVPRAGDYVVEGSAFMRKTSGAGWITGSIDICAADVSASVRGMGNVYNAGATPVPYVGLYDKKDILNVASGGKLGLRYSLWAWDVAGQGVSFEARSLHVTPIRIA